MPRRRGIKGEVTQGDRPEWEPLVNAVGERLTRDFMWMFEVELSEPPDRYVSIPTWEIFGAVFRTLHRLGGVTEGQILDSRNAVDRLPGRDARRDVYADVYAHQHRDRRRGHA